MTPNGLSVLVGAISIARAVDDPDLSRAHTDEFTVEDPSGTTQTMRMLSGLIGSGDAVIAGAQAEILTYLASFNDKVLAVDMEAGGLSLACYEHSVITGRSCG